MSKQLLTFNQVGEVVEQLNLLIKRCHHATDGKPKIESIPLMDNPFVEIQLHLKQNRYDMYLYSDKLVKPKVLITNDGFFRLDLVEKEKVIKRVFEALSPYSKGLMF